MFTFLCSPTTPSFVSQAPASTPSTAVEQPVSTALSLSSPPTPGGQISRCLQEFTFTLLPRPPPSNRPPKLLDLFPTTYPSLRDDSSNKNNDTNNCNGKISDSTATCAGQPERFMSPWVRKRLTESDVNGSSRLLVSKEEIVNKYVLPSISQERRDECHSFDGLKVKMRDVDTGSDCELILKQWRSGSYVLTSNWRLQFVDRRDLKEGDVIELLWDPKNLRFFFRKLNVRF